MIGLFLAALLLVAIVGAMLWLFFLRGASTLRVPIISSLGTSVETLGQL
jgi:hypothetical protein